jgi:WD40 repeat protein
MKNHPKFRKTASGELLLNFGRYGEDIEVAAFSGDGSRLLTVQEVGTARIWDTESRQLLQPIRPSSPLEGTDAGPTTNPFQTFIESAALNADGTLALLGLNDGSAGVFSTENGQRLSRMKEPAPDQAPGADSPEEQWELIRAVCFSPDGTLVGLGHYNRCVSIWDATGCRCLDHLQPSSGQQFVSQGAWGRDTLVSSVGISQDNRYVFAGSADGTACIWDRRTGTAVLDAVDQAADIIELFVANDSVRWATSNGAVWQADSGSRPHKILATGQNWWTAVFSPTGTRLLTRTGQEEIDCWSCDGDRRQLAVVEDRLGFRDDLRPFAFGSTDDEYCHLKTKTSIILHQTGSAAEAECNSKFEEMLSSPEHQLLVTRGWADQVELWAFPDGSTKGILPCPEGVCSMALSHDGRLLACGASGSGDGAPSPVRIFRTSDGELVASLEGHKHQVHALAFGPTDQWLISTSLDRSVRKWDLSHEPWAETQRLTDQQLEFHHLHVLSDGRVLLFFQRGIELWEGLDKQLLEIPAPIKYRIRFAIAEDERHIFLTCGDHIEQWSLIDGSLTRRIQPEIPRPLRLPTSQLHKEIRAEAGASVWQHAGQNFIHLGDGPRGWVTPIALSVDGRLIALPCAKAVAIVTVDEQPRLIQRVPFRGQLRASWCTAEKAKLVNSSGELFTWDGSQPSGK